MTEMIPDAPENVATKADIAGLEARITEVKADMLKVAIAIAVGIVVASVSLTVILVGLLLR